MSARVRIIGLGQTAAGDDGAGLAVIRELRGSCVSEEVELLEIAEPSALLPLLATEARVIVVDAVLGEPVGEVKKIPIDELQVQDASVSTHGLGVAKALRLARVLSPSGACNQVEILAIRIAQPSGHRLGLSDEIADAVRRAADFIRETLQRDAKRIQPEPVEGPDSLTAGGNEPASTSSA